MVGRASTLTNRAQAHLTASPIHEFASPIASLKISCQTVASQWYALGLPTSSYVKWVEVCSFIDVSLYHHARDGTGTHL